MVQRSLRPVVPALFWACAAVSGLSISSPANAESSKVPAYRRLPQNSGTDPYMSKLWHLDAIGAKDAWRITTGNHDTPIAVIDSGIDYTNLDLNPNLKILANGTFGHDYIWPAQHPYDRTGHGTIVAGIAAAAMNNAYGTSGVCPDCSILSYRYLNYEGLGDTEDEVFAIYQAIKDGAKVINISSAGEGKDDDLERALKKAGEKDVVVVVAAANDGENLGKISVYPAKYSFPHMLVVAASGTDDDLIARSNWSKKFVDLAAPGDKIYGPWINERTKQPEVSDGDGTSLATPVVSGVVGLIRAARPDLSAQDVVSIVRATVRKVPALKEKVKTGGIVDAEAALRCASDEALPCLQR